MSANIASVYCRYRGFGVFVQRTLADAPCLSVGRHIARKAIVLGSREAPAASSCAR